MTAYFLDSSAVIKRHVIESGSVWIRSIAASDRRNYMIVARITQIEVVSGLARLLRERKLAHADVSSARELLDRHMLSEYAVVEFDAALIRRSQNLLLVHSLRAYDAVQLASALDNAARLRAAGLVAPVFVSADRRLLAAAEAEGLVTDDPNAH